MFADYRFISPREELEAFIADSGMAIAMCPEEEAGFYVRGFMFDEGTGFTHSSRSFFRCEEKADLVLTLQESV